MNNTNNKDIPTLSGAVLLAQHTADEASNIISHIEATGASVTVVENGQQVIKQILTVDFELILLYSDLPILNAQDTLKGLRQLGYNQAVYLIQSSDLSQDYAQEGFNEVLTSPVEPTKLYAILQKYLTSAQQAARPKNALSDSLQAKIAELKPVFLASLQTQYQQLNEHIENQDFAQIAKILHIVKGSAGNFGYKALTDVADKALMSLRLEQLDEAPALIAKVIISINKILNDEESCDSKN
jgi:CheY-like chemotaxis protein